MSHRQDMRDAANKDDGLTAAYAEGRKDQAEEDKAELDAMRADAERFRGLLSCVEDDGHGWWLPEFAVRIHMDADSRDVPSLQEFRAAVDDFLKESKA